MSKTQKKRGGLFEVFQRNNNNNNKKNQKLLSLAKKPCSTDYWGDSLKRILKQGVDVNAVDKEGNTSLHLYLTDITDDITETCYNQIQILLDYPGLDVTIKNNLGKTALHCAAYREMDEFIEPLVNMGCDVNETTVFSLTPLHYACYMTKRKYFEPLRNDFTTIPILIKHNADVMARDQNGNTPLHYLIRHLFTNEELPEKGDYEYEETLFSYYKGPLQMLKLFAEKKADIYAQNNDQQTPMDMRPDLFGSGKNGSVLGRFRNDLKPTILEIFSQQQPTTRSKRKRVT